MNLPTSPVLNHPSSSKAWVQQRVDAVNAQLASYETIKRWAVMEPPLTVDAGWLTPSLKVRRKKVYEAFRGAFEALYDEARG